MGVSDGGSGARDLDARLASAKENLDDAAGELERAVGVLRQAVADGTAPAGVQMLIGRLEQAAARARARLAGSGEAAVDQSAAPPVTK